MVIPQRKTLLYKDSQPWHCRSIKNNIFDGQSVIGQGTIRNRHTTADNHSGYEIELHHTRLDECIIIGITLIVSVPAQDS
jgi:hypothetical protein